MVGGQPCFFHARQLIERGRFIGKGGCQTCDIFWEDEAARFPYSGRGNRPRAQHVLSANTLRVRSAHGKGIPEILTDDGTGYQPEPNWPWPVLRHHSFTLSSFGRSEGVWISKYPYYLRRKHKHLEKCVLFFHHVTKAKIPLPLCSLSHSLSIPASDNEAGGKFCCGMLCHRQYG